MKITSTNKCIWIVDTIRQHKAITLKDLNVLWLASDYSNGRPLSRAGFYCLRKAALDLFGVTISTNLSTFEYYIEEDTKYYRNTTVSDWLLNTSILNDALMSAGEVASRIELEYVPSAKEYLKPIIKALQEKKIISIDYQPFTKNVATTDIKLAPYFLKIFKQRWYVIGKDMKEHKIKTYALDRIIRLNVTDINYLPDRSMTPENYFRDLFGIESNKSQTVEIRIKAKERDAKYLRALPLHHSQEELVDVGYSIFVYRLKITNDLVRELLSMGKGVEVIAPQELRTMMEETLRAMISNYGYTCQAQESGGQADTAEKEDLSAIGIPLVSEEHEIETEGTEEPSDEQSVVSSNEEIFIDSLGRTRKRRSRKRTNVRGKGKAADKDTETVEGNVANVSQSELDSDELSATPVQETSTEILSAENGQVTSQGKTRKRRNSRYPMEVRRQSAIALKKAKKEEQMASQEEAQPRQRGAGKKTL